MRHGSNWVRACGGVVGLAYALTGGACSSTSSPASGDNADAGASGPGSDAGQGVDAGGEASVSGDSGGTGTGDSGGGEGGAASNDGGQSDAAGASAPTANSAAAAEATARDNALCTRIAPFYWEVGNASAALVSGSVAGEAGATVTSTTIMPIASASKWLYGMYVVQTRGAAANLTPDDIEFLNFTSGYTNMGSDTNTSECPSTDNPDTVDACLLRVNPANGKPFSYQDPTTIGRFDYDGGHEENHANLHGNVGNVPVSMLGATVSGMLGPGVSFTYTQPLLAGGIDTSADTYGRILRHVLDGSLYMHDALGIDAVCTLPSASCNAVSSPTPEAWHYSIAHWVEDDPTTNGDGALSSAGAFGFYPWIEAGKQFYGIVARHALPNGAIREGYESAQCGRLIRRAWDTGVEQTGMIPH